MAGYTRQSESGIVDGGVISASDFNEEFNCIACAMGTSGHTHDGTAGNGPKINTAGIATNAVTADKINAEAVSTAKLAGSSVTTAKIADDAVTGAKVDSTTTLTAACFCGPIEGNVTGNVTGSSGSCTGNAATATKLQTARNIEVQVIEQ